MSPIVYMNGSFVEAADAMVSAYDGGWLHGAGLFETMRAEHGRVFRLGEHLNRLTRSAERLLHVVDDFLPTSVQVEELLKRNNLTDARVRLTVSSGSVLVDSSTQPRPTVCMTAAPLKDYPEAFYKEGVQVIVSAFRQSPNDPIAGHKTTAYFPRLIALRAAQQASCIEALWITTDGNLAEGCISNVFLVKEGVLKTPPLETPVLPGIARAVVLRIAEGEGIEARTVRLTIDDLLDADEVMLTNSIMQVLPVNSVERHEVGQGRVGPIAKILRAAYQDVVRKECMQP